MSDADSIELKRVSLNLLITLQKGAEQAKDIYEKELRTFAEEHGSTFEYDGKWYQIRTRNSRRQAKVLTYLCELPSAPGEWLKGRKKGEKKPKKEQPEEVITSNDVVME